MTYETESCIFVRLSTVVAESETLFYANLSEDAPFSWGDNNRSMVTVNRILDHMHGSGFDELYPITMGNLGSMPIDMYVDLEN